MDNNEKLDIGTKVEHIPQGRTGTVISSREWKATTYYTVEFDEYDASVNAPVRMAVEASRKRLRVVE